MVVQETFQAMRIQVIAELPSEMNVFPRVGDKEFDRHQK
jgi:hypothetical protein